MKIAPLADVKAKFSNYVDNIGDGPVIVTRNGRAAAVLVSIPDGEDELESFILAHTPRFRRLIDSAYERIRTTGGVTHKDFWRKVGKSR